MAENAQERTEQATPKRLEEARRKGQIPRSRDLSAAAVTLAGGAALYMMGGQIGGRLHGMMSRGLTLTREQALDPAYLLPALVGCGGRRTACLRAGARHHHARGDPRAAGARRLELQHGSRWRRSSAG